MARIIFFASLTITLIGLETLSVMAGTPVYLGDKQHSALSMDKIDHAAWNQLLRSYVDQNGRVDYERWNRSPTDVLELDGYLRQLSNATRSTAATRNSRLAFWINAYNAVTVRGILREYPTTSIRNHTPRLFGYHIWKDLQLYVGGQPVSLDQMEHEILRRMSEPRIHFAIVCASIGCPRLWNTAYRAEAIEEQLERSAKDFFSRSQNFQYDASENTFQLSAILDWFGEDFGDSQATRLRRIAPWLPTPEAVDAARKNSVDVSYIDYDWKLNEQ